MAETTLRYVEMDAQWRMKPDALAAAIASDRASGLRPWLIIGSAGTTDTGAVDPLHAIADVAQREQCWFHVDAAYGGYFLLTEYGRNVMRGIERSDSVVLDPHKSLFLPYGAGIVLVRDAAKLVAANVYDAAYMQDALEDGGELSPADLSPELTKHFRAMRMWLPLKVVGTAAFTAALDEKLLLARYFRTEIARRGFAVGPEPDLTVIPFRWAPPGMSSEEANQINELILRALRRDGRIFLSSTVLDGKFTIRFVALQFRTHLATVDLALRLLDEFRAEISGQLSH
jgi:glutamate/tyrosine decarboxylase-like PLP-dependent enzyme